MLIDVEKLKTKRKKSNKRTQSYTLPNSVIEAFDVYVKKHRVKKVDVIEELLRSLLVEELRGNEVRRS